MTVALINQPSQCLRCQKRARRTDYLCAEHREKFDAERRAAKKAAATPVDHATQEAA